MFAAVKKHIFHSRRGWLFAAVITFCSTVLAMENGGSSFPHGIENHGMGALPPPGWYGVTYAEHYHSTDLKNNAGDTVAVPFKVDVDVIAQRFIWVSGYSIAGGNLAAHVVLPLIRVDSQLATRTQSKTGLGDIATGVGVGWHHSPNLHSIAAVDVIAPTGRYDKNDLANTGRNYWASEPYYTISYLNPAGFNGDIRLAYLFNGRNHDTDYKSGQEFHFDYAMGWGVASNWVVGVGGYYYLQTTADQSGGNDVPNSKARAFAVGPNIKYDSGKGFFVVVKWQQEMLVRNRPEGNALWIKAAFPL